MIKGDFAGSKASQLLRTALNERSEDYLNFTHLTDRKIFDNEALMTKAKSSLLHSIKREKFKASPRCFYPISYNPATDNTVYELPDDKHIILGREAGTIPERFFYKEAEGEPRHDPTCL